MEDIKMTSTKAFYARIKPELDAAFSTVMAGSTFDSQQQTGLLAKTLEECLWVSYALPLASSSEALQLALLALKLPAGAEVIVPAFGHTVVAEAVLHAGLTPVFADVDADTFTVSPASVAQQVKPATGAIVPVHLFGQCADMKELMNIAASHNIHVVEDATQALGASYLWPSGETSKAGTIGHLGIVSFFPSKPEAEAGEGAAVLTNDFVLSEGVHDIFTGGAGTLQPKKLDALQAAMLEVKVRHEEAFNAARGKAVQFYDQALAVVPQVQLPHRASYSSHTYLAYTIRVAPALRNGLQQYLRDHFIPSAVYYPQPLHLLPALNLKGYQPGDFPVAESLSQCVLSLPLHSELKEDQLSYICQHVIDYVQQNCC